MDLVERLQRAASALDSAEAVVIGAGAGLSAAAGFAYSGKRFQENFADFEEKYGFHDMYSGGFYPYPTQEEFWAYWSRYIFINRYQDPPKPIYRRLLERVKDKDYFVITTNVDHCFQKAGFDKSRLFYTQGDYGSFQCSLPCHGKTYDNRDAVFRMMKEQREMKIPSELIPRCPVCGRPMAMNLRSDDHFVEDDGWRHACENYRKFLGKCRKKRVVYLELGVGWNTPAIIKYPFWEFTQQNPSATYICVNMEAVCPDEIKQRSLLIDADISVLL